MDYCDALIEAEVQLDWGLDPAGVQRAVEHLKGHAPNSPLLRALQLKLVRLRLAQELARI